VLGRRLTGDFFKGGCGFSERHPPLRAAVDSAEGMATLEAMQSPPRAGNKLILEPPIAASDEHARLVEADQRFQAALGQAIATGGERIEAVEATVQLERRRKKLPR
jgi:hypothetical protein